MSLTPMTKNDGKQFESLTETVFNTLKRNEQYTEVVRDTKLEGPDGEKRQIDVLVRTRAFGFLSTTMVECRDKGRPLDLDAIDGLESKSKDLPVDVVVLVSRNGFTKNAIKKAKRNHIRLCTLDQPEDIADLGLDMQMCVVEIMPHRF